MSLHSVASPHSRSAASEITTLAPRDRLRPAGRPTPPPGTEFHPVNRIFALGESPRPCDGRVPLEPVEEPAAGPLDDRQFAGLVVPWLGHLTRVARRIVESDDLAWEAVQEALVSLWQQGGTPPANARAWLSRAVVHRSLHLRRTIRRRREHEARACQVRPERVDHGDPLRRVLLDEARAELRAALAALEPKHRDVIVLHVWEGLDYETIAARLQIPIGTVRSRLHRGREALRASLVGDRPGDDLA